MRCGGWTILVLAPVCGAAVAAAAEISVARALVTLEVNDRVCVAPKPAREVPPSARQAFLWTSLRNVRAGSQIRIDWLAPDGATALSAPYQDLPGAPELCVISQLPVAGFGPARQPGEWTVRIVAGGQALTETRFRITPEPDHGEPRIASVERTETGGGREIEFTVLGSGFREGTRLHIAQYTRANGWKYLVVLRPASLEPNRLTAKAAALPPSDYVLIAQNADGKYSLPEPFVVATGRAYRLPTAAGDPWLITQGPYGTFSHWGNSLHAFDIAPRGGRCTVAMRAGVVSAHDRGMRQDVRSRSFGNYISIDHGDGEFSHYAHLESGSFVVRTGERVEAGQALALAGNSGYTLGAGGGVHLHVHVTRAANIAAQSVPFRFDEAGAWKPGSRYVPVVSKLGGSGTCAGAAVPTMVSRAGAGTGSSLGTVIPGSVSPTEWWNDFVWVPKNAGSLETLLLWNDKQAALDLHLMGPDGRHYGWYGEKTGHSGRETNPQTLRVERPAEGWWRIAVQSARGGPGATEFEVRTSGQRPDRAWKAGAVGGAQGPPRRHRTR